MSEFSQSIKEKLWQDLQAIAQNLCKSHGLKYNPKLECHIDRWISFVIRLVEPKERFTDFSKGFWNRIPKECLGDVHFLADKFEHGDDVNPYQSTTIKTNNLAKSVGRRTDLLWVDWDIRHFHLKNSNNLDEKGFAERSDFLLFAVVRNDCVYFLDVRRHPQKEQMDECFSDPSLIKLFIESWPEIAEFNHLAGITPDEKLDYKKIAMYRKMGLNVATSYKGRAYSMSLGLGAGGSPMIDVLYHDMLNFELDSLAESLAEYLKRNNVSTSSDLYSFVMKDGCLKLLCSVDGSCYDCKSQNLEQLNRFFNQSWLLKTLVK